MTWLRTILWLVVLAAFPALSSVAQSQSCPVNINFSDGTLTHWEAYTGNNAAGNAPDAIKVTYDSAGAAPNGTRGATDFPEYNLPGVSGIRMITYQGTDVFGGFPMIPTINGYTYPYTILLGSTSVSHHNQGLSPGDPPPTNATNPEGGYVRGVSYLINVPPGPPTVPYTISYAYAMVLENGTHASEEQPMARAILTAPGGAVIDCASPAYFLPTDGLGLDSATARANGFTPSLVPTPNASPTSQGNSLFLQDVWTKGWTEVTFDLSPYRGQQVSLTFEADNCVPGGHFAYAYFALKNTCAGLQISGDSIACTNSIAKYSIPLLQGASVNWSAPPGWTPNPASTGPTIAMKVGPQPGWIVAKEQNSCTSLSDSFFVQLYPGALPESATDPHDTTVCFGSTVSLHAVVNTGTSYNWVTPEYVNRKSSDTILSLPFAINIVTTPEQSTNFIVNIRNAGCPITIADTITVVVVPPIIVNPGHDTIVVVDEPLHFQATSSDRFRDDYQWSPSTDLSNPDASDPIGIYGYEMNAITYLVRATDTFGCTGTATVKVTIAHTLPNFFVPNAFTPAMNSNSLFRPICLGISSLEYFRVYNRWGQLMYSTSRIGQGWDGKIEGKLQETSTYLWILQGTDYNGKVISKKGTVMLIR